VSCLFAVLVAVRLASVLPRLLAVVRRRSIRSALRVATANVLVNGYLCLFALIFGYIARIGGYFGIQGRYWFPEVGAVFFCALVLAPRVFSPRLRTAVQTLAIGAVLGLEGATLLGTVPSLNRRFAPAVPARPSAEDVHLDATVVREGAELVVRGVAIDLRDAAPVRAVALRIDDARTVAARAVERPDVACKMESTLLRSGYEARLPIRDLAPGLHRVVPIAAAEAATIRIDPR